MGKDVKQATGLLVRRTRIKRKFTQKVLAIKAGTYKQHISDIERGKENPQISTLYAIAIVFEVSVAYLTDIKKQIMRPRLFHQADRPDPDAFKKMIGERITNFREQKKLSILAFSKLAELDTGRLARIENGTVDFTLATLWCIANGLGMSMAKVLDIYDEIEPEPVDENISSSDRQPII